MNFIEKKNVSFIPQADKIIIDPKSIRSILNRLKAAALKNRIRNPESGIRNPESGNGIMETETETEYGICERRFQAIDLKNKNISNDNKINKQIKKRHK